jgi:hypothetical protein
MKTALALLAISLATQNLLAAEINTDTKATSEGEINESVISNTQISKKSEKANTGIFLGHFSEKTGSKPLLKNIAPSDTKEEIKATDYAKGKGMLDNSKYSGTMVGAKFYTNDNFSISPSLLIGSLESISTDGVDKKKDDQKMKVPGLRLAMAYSTIINDYFKFNSGLGIQYAAKKETVGKSVYKYSASGLDLDFGPELVYKNFFTELSYNIAYRSQKLETTLPIMDSYGQAALLNVGDTQKGIQESLLLKIGYYF